MANARDIEMKLPSLDELFSSQEERDDAKLKRIYEIPLDEIDPFPEHPFKVRDDEDMMNLVESVKVNGVLTPATVRKKDGGRYELLSGHRRMRACQIAGLETLRCEVVDMSRDEATIFMVESNFQRTKILPSEKAFAFKMKMDAMKHKGYRSDLSLSHGATKLNTGEDIGDSAGISRSQVHRYIRLTYLIPKLLDMVDDGRLSFVIAGEISYFNHTYQQWLWEYIHENGMIKQEQLMDLRQYRDDDSLTQEQMIDILIQKRATPQIKKKVTFNERKLNKYFPAYYSQSEIERIMISLLEEWKRTHESEDT